MNETIYVFDLRLPPRSGWELHSSGVFRSQ